MFQKLQNHMATMRSFEVVGIFATTFTKEIIIQLLIYNFRYL
jgi:hypothetical protein